MENKIKLLLVEDDSMLTYVVKSSLEGLIGGYEVITAVNGQEGLKAYQEYHPDIIISDVDMPVMNGLQMVERIREVDGNIPILLASALGSPKDVTSGYKLGADNYVKKPFVAEELDAVLPTDTYDTFGGYICGMIDRVPNDGERFRCESEELVIDVMEVENHTIGATVVKRKEKAPDEEENTKPKRKALEAE